MEYWMQVADGAQYDLKVLSHEFLFRAARHLSDTDMETFESDVENPVLVDFLRVYIKGDKLPVHMVSDSINKTDAWFRQLDDALAGRQWLAGDALSLADIAWMPNFHRFDLLRWPLKIYPNLMRWFETASDRPSYRKALDGWEPKALMDKVLPILDERRANNDGIDSYGPIADL